MKAYGGMDVFIHILTLTFIEGEWSASHPGHFSPVEKPQVPTGQAPDPVWMTRRKFLTLPGLKLRSFDRPVSSYTDYANPAFIEIKFHSIKIQTYWPAYIITLCYTGDTEIGRENWKGSTMAQNNESSV
jgi:hypothetical protein